MVSCSKNDDAQQPEQLSDPNFYALEVGNSWTYEYFKRIGNTEEFATTNAFDEVRITGTSEIDGNTFYTLETTTSGNDNSTVCVPPNGIAVEKIRDSLGYLVNDRGTIFFSNENELEYMAIENPVEFYNLFGVLIPDVENIESIAGTFPCLRNETYAKFTNGSHSPGRNFVFYSDELGKILETFSFVSSSSHYAEKRLISYSSEN